MANENDLSSIIAAVEKKQDLPPGLLQTIIDSNGTGISPASRKTILDTYGIDARLNPANAVEAAGILLNDAMAKNKGDEALALAEYRSGEDRTSWSGDTKKFVSGVLGKRSGRGVNMAQIGAPQRASTDPAPAFDMQMGEPTITGSGVDVAKLAQSTAAAGEPEGPVQMGPKSLAAYTDGTMPAEKRAAVRRLVQSGAIIVPDGFSLEEPGMMTRAGAAIKGIGEAVTGSQRRTPETEAAPDWSQIPEWTDLGTLKNVAALAASPEEALQILTANSPGMKVRKDEKGNLFAFSPKAGKEFAVKPGLDFGDVVRAGSVLPIYAAGAASGVGIPAMMGREALVQGGIEVAQAASGGEFNPTDIAAAGLTAGVIPVAQAAGQAVRRGVSRAANIGLDAIPGSTTRQAAEAAAAPVVADVVEAVAPAVAKSTDAIPMEQLGVLVRQANKTGPDATAAKVELARLASVNPEADAAIKRLGMDAPLDLLSDNAQIKNVMGLARSKIGSEAQAQFEGAVDNMVARADDRMKEFGAITVDGAPSQSGASTRVLGSLKATQAELAAAEAAAHDSVDSVIPLATEVRVDALRDFMDKVATDVGEANLSAAEKRLMAFAKEPHPTYGGVRRQAAYVGKALEGRLADEFSNMDDAALKRLYGAIAQSRGDAAEQIGGKVLRDQLEAANKLSVAKFKVQDRITEGFGRGGNGDLAGKMTQAMTAAKKDGSKPLMDLLDVVPEGLHKDVVSTALASAVSKGGKFSPEAFVSFYEGLRTNEAAYSKIAGILGPESRQVLQDMFVFSKRLASSKKKVQYTGKANQELEAALAGDNLIFRILETAPGKGIAAAAGGTVGGAIAGPVGSMAGAGAAVAGVEALLAQRKNVLPSIGKLMSSDEFGDLARMANTMTPAAVEASPKMKDAIRKVVASQWWRDFVKAAKMPRDPKSGERFLTAALQAALQAAIQAAIQTRGEQ